MNNTNPPEIDGLEAFIARLQMLGENAYDALARLSQNLDQLLGAEVTTMLTVGLGLISLILALLPFSSAWRRPAEPVASPATQDDVKRNALGEEIVQMHPERLQQLYGVQPITSAAAPEVAAVEPAATEVSTPTARHDVLLGLVADLSNELAEQQQAMKVLKRLSEQQQQQVDALLAQVKAQSSAFLLQGERLLRLESLAEPAASAATGSEESVQRLSTFDHAIELAGQGASAEALMAECGLSVSEARLVVLVHGK